MIDTYMLALNNQDALSDLLTQFCIFIGRAIAQVFCGRSQPVKYS